MSETNDSGLDRELGVNRRDLIRRGAVVGGTLLWATPVVQSIGSKAMAQTRRSPGQCGCCYCFNAGGQENPTTFAPDECHFNGTFAERATEVDCERYCRDEVGYDSYSYCSGTVRGDCDCQTAAQAAKTGGTAGCVCDN
jgi:hypothetical protein